MSRSPHEDAQRSESPQPGASAVSPSHESIRVSQPGVSPAITRLERHPASFSSRAVTRALRRQVRRD